MSPKAAKPPPGQHHLTSCTNTDAQNTQSHKMTDKSSQSNSQGSMHTEAGQGEQPSKCQPVLYTVQ